MHFLLGMIPMCKSPEAMWLLLVGLGQNRAVSPGTVLAINSTVYHMALLEPGPGCVVVVQLQPKGPKYRHFLYGRMYVRNSNKEMCKTLKHFA